tara:strand:+ start:276 stop:437 length:162 start_codon:yes stop_codon:yes gene_type:complete
MKVGDLVETPDKKIGVIVGKRKRKFMVGYVVEIMIDGNIHTLLEHKLKLLSEA